ncbi:MAG: 5-(carboxyamino)imidazole ribonucleotide synthase [Alphaproteobacteria bacterium]
MARAFPSTSRSPLAPGSIIGILGGGQLGRMTALAAARLGYRCHVFTPEHDSPAEQVCAAATIAGYDDKAALARFAAAIDVCTFEFENVPFASLAVIAARVPVRPGVRALRVSQDRLREKAFFRSLGVPVAPYRAVRSARALAQALEHIGRPAILKTTRLGYDGKGQVRIGARGGAAEAWERLGGREGVLEAKIDFAYEISVVTARALDGRQASYVPVRNRHKDGILDTTTAPAACPSAVARRAIAIAERCARALGIVGVLCVEMFVENNGRVLANELAPRPHNSGHWTIDACLTSQFEQHARAVVGLPLGSPERHSNAVMRNLIGEDVLAWRALAAKKRDHLHLYGKTEARAGRKMGHVTRLSPKR